MPTHGIIALLPVTPGAATGLRDALNSLGNDIRHRHGSGTARPIIDFPSSDTLHFVRLALVADPDRGPEHFRLLLVTDFDGTTEDHLGELHRLTSDPMAVWGRCEGYDGGKRFPLYVCRHVVNPQAYYMAFPDDSLGQIRDRIRLREQVESVMGGDGEITLGRAFERGLEILERGYDFGLAATLFLIRHGVQGLMAARRINTTMNRVWWIRLLNRLTFNSPPPLRHNFSEAPVVRRDDCAPACPEDEVVPSKDWTGVPLEDVVSQNQLTLVTVVRAGRLDQLKNVLAVIELFSKYFATAGSLIGISTIHTVRWTLLDGGRRLLMVSNYDNSWENYIDEFAEMILSGLDAIWENCHGWPEAGARDVEALKHFLRCHQVPANTFYSAYPQATVLNILDGFNLEQQAR